MYICIFARPPLQKHTHENWKVLANGLFVLFYAQFFYTRTTLCWIPSIKRAKYFSVFHHVKPIFDV